MPNLQFNVFKFLSGEILKYFAWGCSVNQDVHMRSVSRNVLNLTFVIDNFKKFASRGNKPKNFKKSQRAFLSN